MALDYKDYYAALGVEKKASQDEIQRAYRKLARKYHPDVNKDDGAEDRFKEITEAYEVLKDADKRKTYDQYGSAWKHAQASGGAPPGFENIRFEFGGGGAGASGFSSFFDALFGGGGGAGGFGGGGFGGFGDGAYQQRAMRGRNHEATLKLDLEEAVAGGKREITLSDGGRGRNKVEVNLPPGVKPGQKIRLSGRGGAAPPGGEAGDLFLKVELRPHPRFRLEGKDLHASVPITPWEAALGGQVSVPTLGSSVMIKLPSGSNTGKRIRLRGKGYPDRAGDGDLFIEFQIVVPSELSDEERELFEQLATASTFAPRE
ncbi:MAG: J domain-containing protein [Acidobacteriota bacterium]